jgi:cell division protease FtsH
MANEKPKEGKGQFIRAIILWAIIFGSIYLVIQFFQGEKYREVSFTRFWNYVETEEIQSVTFEGQQITAKLKGEGGLIKTRLPYEDPELPRELISRGIEVNTKIEFDFWKIFWQFLPILFIVFFFLFIFNRMRGGANEALSFGQSRAREIRFTSVNVTFDDVAGVEEAKRELQEVVQFLKNPSQFKKLGARIPKGVLLVGAPGTGKTLLARAVAGEAAVPFYSISGSDFVEMFVGVGASRVRDLFRKAKINTPCIVFIDEIDAVGRFRGAGIGGGHDEREQTLNALLVEMDGFDPNEGIIILSATNRPDILDPALLRPGRFDRRVVVPMPDMNGREAILKVHTKNIPIADDVDLSIFAKTTPGFSGADLQNLANEAALIAASKKKNKVESEDFDEAKDKILMGVERKSMILSDNEKELIAYHEAGHALVSIYADNSDPIHKVTIIPRGASLGLTQQLPIDDRRTYSRDYLIAKIINLLGGRAAEELKFKTVSTGAGNDLQNATTIARMMVCEWGMSDNLGPISLENSSDGIFLGKKLVKNREYSEETAHQIDTEVKRFIDEAHEKARSILKTHKNELDEIAKALLEQEVLTGDEVKEIIDGSKKDKKSN